MSWADLMDEMEPFLARVRQQNGGVIPVVQRHWTKRFSLDPLEEDKASD